MSRWRDPAATLAGASELALFLLYITLNLAWTSLRSISIAVDVFVFYERLELVRRVVTIATMLAMLGGLPLGAFLIGSNILWGALFAVATSKARATRRLGAAPARRCARVRVVRQIEPAFDSSQRHRRA